MSSDYTNTDTADTLFSGLSRLHNTEASDQVFQEALEIAVAIFEESVVTVWDHSVNDHTFSRAGAAANAINETTIGEPPVESLRARERGRTGGSRSDGVAEAVSVSRSQGPFGSELLAEVGGEYVLGIGNHETDAYDSRDCRIAGGIAATIESALESLGAPDAMTIGAAGESEPGVRDRRQRERDEDAIQQLFRVISETGDYETAVASLLELGCEHFGLERGILSQIDGSDYRIRAISDASDTFESGQTLELAETLCESTIDPDRSEPVAFADIAQTRFRDHPSAAIVSAYIAAPVTVDGATYGTVNFSSETPRQDQFRSGELEFVALVAEWLGNEIERQRQFEELQRYETVLEAIDDPVYALDREGRFTFLNTAAKNKFGYGEEVIGENTSVGMDQADIDRVRHKIQDLIDSDERSTTVEFELGTANGERRIVENRLALIDDGEFRGSAGVLRDITDRVNERRQLEEFRRAVEQAADGVAILDGEEYEYVDKTHVEMYGFENEDQLLGDTWRKLYDDAEIDRLESEAFPALESAGYWGGRVTGTRPDGSQFPAELSLTIVDDGRLVCTVRDETEQQARKRELETRLAAMEAAIDGIALLDGDGEYTYVNQAHADIYGYDSPEAFSGNHWGMCYNDAEHDRLTTTAIDTLSTGESWRGKAVGAREDGTTFPQEVALTKLDTGYICVVRDITERKARQRELELKERAMDEASVGIQITDATSEDNELVYVNDGFERITGYTAEEVLGTNPRFLQGEKTGSASVDRLRSAIDDEEPISIELRNERKDGTSYWSKLSVTPVRDGTGSVANYIGIQQDVTDRMERQRELRAERERFELLVESIDEYAFIVLNKDGDIETWNSSAADLYGYDGETTIGMAHGRLYPEGNRATGLPDRLLQQAHIAGESAHEGWCLRADGSQFYADVRYAPLNTDEAEFRGYALVVRDMTDRRRQRRRTELFVQQSDDVVCILDDDGTFDYVSGSANRILGYERDSLVGTNLFDYLHPNTREQAMETFFASVNSSDEIHRAEFRFETDAGEWRTVRARCRSMQAEPAIGGILLYLRDVTELKERTRRFESIFNQTFQFTGLLDTDGTVREMNEAGLEFSGTDRTDIVGTGFDEMQWWDHSEQTREEAMEALDRATRGNFVRYETEAMGADGIRTIDLSLKPVLDGDGGVSLLVFEGRDITDRQRRGQHLAVLERVMRHNIRNDLTKLRGWTQMLFEADAEADREAKYATVRKILDRWEQLTDRIRHIRHLLDSQAVHDETRTLSTVVDDAVAATRDAHPDAAVTTDVEQCGRAMVPVILEEAIRELLSNAVTASEESPVAVDCHRPSDEWIELTVADRGPGLPDTEAEVLTTGEETPLSHGQGLGLWMVRMVTSEIGGDVSVDGSADGTRITLRIPTRSPISDTGAKQ